ncbi:LPXTG cell wall anchor domain-containing protein [Streptomyces marincola]|uniref:LPXTG cell wall anchor domain-containing protein n=1 Tax=Streptomyces marincola TaxID=2878388 RepID=UPI001CF13529|nr:LPXTG cell wall anchor domain-containing protein [Streptomyces marincola]UCM88359.1 LPXTG cell wall anchor domain-containing protein [Streptomyces marincola]
MARIAAAAVFAAGASLAVVGTASASDDPQPQTLAGNPDGDDGGVISGLIEGNEGGGEQGGGEQGGGEQGGGEQGGGEQGGGEQGGGEQGGGEQGGGEQGGGEQGGGEQGGGEQGGGEQGGGEQGGGEQGGGEQGGGEQGGGEQGGGEQGGGEQGGGEQGGQDGDDDGDDDNSVQGVTEGGSTGGLNPDGENNRPIEQNNPSEDLTDQVQTPVGDQGDGPELAETGASTNQTLLIVGAATMIAGGVAFRYLPRLINKDGATPA